jgi:hypothetical protein
MKKVKLAALLSFVGVALAPTAAYAGSPVYGYGTTRSAAARDANQNAADASRDRFQRADCYTPARPQDCRQESGEWICIAYVANHRGSCGF